MKKQWAIYTITELVYAKKDSLFKADSDKVIRIHKFLGIPLLRVIAEKITTETEN